MIILRSSNRYTWTAVLLNCVILSSLLGPVVCAPKKILEQCKSFSTKMGKLIAGKPSSEDFEVMYDVTVTDPEGNREEGLKAVYEECASAGHTWNFYAPAEDGELKSGNNRFWFAFRDMDIQPRQADEKDDMVFFHVKKSKKFKTGRYAAEFESAAIAMEFQTSILDKRRPQKV